MKPVQPFFCLIAAVSLFSTGWLTAQNPAQKEAFQQVTQSPQSERVLRRYLDSWFDDKGFQNLEAFLLENYKEDRQATAAEWMAVTRLWEAIGGYPHALVTITKATDKDPTTADYWLKRAGIEARLDLYNEAAASLDKIPATTAPETLLKVIEMHKLVGNYKPNYAQLSAQKVSEFIKAHSTDPRALKILLREVQQGGRMTSVHQSLKEQLAKVSDPEINHEWRKIALADALESYKPPEITALAKSGIEESAPGSEEELFYLSALLKVIQQNRSSTGIELAQSIAETYSDRPVIWKTLVHTLDDLNYGVDALKLLETLKAKQPKNILLDRELAQMLMEMGRESEAITLLKNSFKEAPQDDHRRIFLAQLLHETGQDDEGAPLLESWASAPDSDMKRVQQTQMLLSLMRTPEQIQAWKSKLPDNLKETQPLASTATQATTPAPPAPQVEGEEKDIKTLLQAWRANPHNIQTVKDLIIRWSRSDQQTEMCHILLQTHYSLPDLNSRIQWWLELYPHYPPAQVEVAWRLENDGEHTADRILAKVLTQAAGTLRSSAIEEAARLAPNHLKLRHLWLQALISEGLPTKALANTSHTNTSSDRLIEALAYFEMGKVEIAQRIILEFSLEPALDADLACQFTSQLIKYREWQTLDVFLSTQRQRYPKDYRLAALNALYLKEKGDPKGAIEKLLQLGSFDQEISNTLLRNRASYQVLAPHSAATRKLNRLHEWYQLSSIISNINNGPIYIPLSGISPDQPNNGPLAVSIPLEISNLHAWATAQLFTLTQDLPSESRAEIAKRGREAGLPWMDVFLIARQGKNDLSGRNLLELDPEILPAHLSEVEVAELYVRLNFIWEWNQKESKATTAKAENFRLCYATLLKAKSELSPSAALCWWITQPESNQALQAVIQSFKGYSVETPSPLSALANTLAKQPLELIRDPKVAAEIVAALNDVPRRQKDTLDEQIQEASDLTRCYLWLGQWERAMTSIDEVASLKDEARAKKREQDEKNISLAIQLHSYPVLAWPIKKDSYAWEFLITREPSPGIPLVKESDLPAFKAALEKLKSPLVKAAILYAIGEGDKSATTIRDWHQKKPDDEMAAHAAACLAQHEKREVAALDILYALMKNQAAGSYAKRTAQTQYIQAAFFSFHNTAYPIQPRSRSSIATPRIPTLPRTYMPHKQKLKEVVQELLPLIKKEKTLFAPWIKICELLDLQSDADFLKKLPQSDDLRPFSGSRLRPLARHSSYHRTWDVEAWSNAHHRWSITYLNNQNTLEESQRERLVSQILQSLKGAADSDFRGIQYAYGQNLEHTRDTIIKRHLADALFKAAGSEKSHSARLLFQQAYIANACSRNEDVIRLLQKAQKIAPQDKSIHRAILLGRLRIASPDQLKQIVSDAATWLERDLLSHLRQQAMNTADINLRLNISEFIILTLKSNQAVLEAQKVDSILLQSAFEILTNSHSSATTYLPPLYSEPDTQEREPPISTVPEAALQRRKRQHAELCELALTLPEWYHSVSRYLMQYHLAEGKPSADEFIRYMQKAQAMSQGQFQPLNAVLDIDYRVKDARHRLKAASLFLKALSALSENVNPVNSQQFEPLMKLISAEIVAKDQPKMWSLLEWPYPIKTEPGKYTPEQVEWNRERNALMTEFFTWVIARPQLSAPLFGHWASYQLFDEQPDFEQILKQAQRLKDAPQDPYGLISLLQVAEQSASNVHIIKTSEATLKILKAAGPSTDLVPLEASLTKLLDRLRDGGQNPSTQMPILSMSPEEAEKGEPALSVDFQKRRQAAYEDLVQLLSAQNMVLPSILFGQLESKILEGQDSSAIEKSLQDSGRKNRRLLAEGLTTFIKKSFGVYTPQHDSRGSRIYVGGVWDAEQRVRWFEAAWRIGQPLLEEDQGPEIQSLLAQPMWINEWLGNLMQPSSNRTPVIPPILGLELGHGFNLGDALSSYEALPALKRRDELFLEVLKVCLDRDWAWSTSFDRYAKILMMREPAPGDLILATALKQLKKNPASVAEGLEGWLRWEGQHGSMTRLLAAANIVNRILAEWPREDSRTSDAWIKAARNFILVRDHSQPIPRLRLLAGRPWGENYTNEGAEMHLPSMTRRSEWWKLVNQAIQIPAFKKAVFNDYARIHLTDKPDQVAQVATELLQQDPRMLGYSLHDIFEEEFFAPVSRRIEWAKLLVHLLPLIKQDGTDSDASTDTFREALKFLQADPIKTEDTQQRPPQPTEAELKERDRLLDLLTAQIMKDPALAAEGYPAYARTQFKGGKPPEETHQKGLKILAQQSRKLSNSIQSWMDELRHKNASRSEILWSLKVLVPLAEVWPTSTEDSPYWMSQTASLLTTVTPYIGSNDEENELLKRFWLASFKYPLLTPPVLAALAWHTSTNPVQQQQLVSHIIGLAKSDLKGTSKLLNEWWNTAYAHASYQSRAQSAQTALLILKQWPAQAAPASLAWGEELLRFISAPPFHLDYSLLNARSFHPISSPCPEDKSARLVFQAITQDLRRLKVTESWLVGAFLRHASRANNSPEKREEELRILFTDESDRKAAVSYLTQVLDNGINLPDTEEVRHLRKAKAVIIQDAQVKEVLDATRCLMIVSEKKWLDTASFTPLGGKVQKSLQDILDTKNVTPPPSVHGRRNQPILSELLKETETLLNIWNGGPPSTLKGEVKGSQVPIRIKDGYRAEQPPTETADAVWEVLQTDAVSAENGLQEWAFLLTSANSTKSLTWAGEVASTLAKRWTPELPAPNWMVNFVQTWGKAISAEVTNRDQVLDSLLATLRKFPSCTAPDYFEVVSGPASNKLSSLNKELVDLTITHLKARSSHPITKDEKPLLPDLSKENAALYSPLTSVSAPLALLEYAWSEKDKNWLDQEIIPVLRKAFTEDLFKEFESLSQLYFCEKSAYSAAALDYVSHLPRATPPVWVLRLAKLRGAPLSVTDWIKLTRLTKATFLEGWDPREMDLPASLWIRHCLETDPRSLEASLQAILQSCIGRNNPREALTSALDPYFVAQKNGLAEHGPDLHFKDEGWQWSWDFLLQTATKPETLPATLKIANQFGFLEQPTAMKGLLSASRSNIPSEVTSERWQSWVDSSDIISKDPLPAQPWLLVKDGQAPIWSFAQIALAPHAKEAVLWLEAAQSHSPHLGRALLLLGAERQGTGDISSAAIEKALQPFREILEQLPRERKTELTATLCVVQPLLPEAILSAAPDSVLKHLMLPSIQSQQERNWLEITPDKLLSGIPYGRPFSPLLEDVLHLITTHGPEAETVLESGIRVLSKVDWKSAVPEGVDPPYWVREQVGLELLRIGLKARSSSSTRSSPSITLRSMPSDDGTRALPMHVLRLLLRRSNDFHAATNRLEFTQLATGIVMHQFQETGYDGEATADTLLKWLPTTDTAAECLLLPAFRQVFLTVPLASAERLCAKLNQAAVSDPKRSTLALVCRQALSETTAIYLGKKADQECTPLQEWSTWLQKAEITPVVRIAIARNLPAALTSNQSAEVLKEVLPLVRMEMLTPPSSSFVKGPVLLLKWISKVPETEETRETLTECARILVHGWREIPDRTRYEVTGSPNSLSKTTILPLLKHLKRVGEKELHDELQLICAQTARLPLEAVLETLKADPKTATETLAHAYFQEDSFSAHSQYIYASEDLPELTQQDVEALATLKQAAQTNTSCLTTYWLLSACPDAKENPPAESRRERIARLAAESQPTPEVWGSIAMLLKVGKLHAHILPELLPLLRRYPAAQLWSKIDDKEPALETGSPEEPFHVRILCYWALAEALYGNHPEIWARLAPAMKKAGATAQNINAPYGAFPGSRSSPRPVPSMWSWGSMLTFREVFYSWIETQPKAEWKKLIPSSIAAIPLIKEEGLAASLSELILVASQSDGDDIWLPLKDKLAMNPPQVQPYSPVVSSLPSWDRIMAGGISPNLRWQIAEQRLLAKSPYYGQETRLKSLFSSKLMDAETFAKKLPELTQDQLWKNTPELGNWLSAAGQHKLALEMIRKLVETPENKGLTGKNWLWLAVQAAELGDLKLAEKAAAKASAQHLSGSDEETSQGILQRFRK